MAKAVNEVNVYVRDALKCQVFISDDQKKMDLSSARTEVIEIVKDFLPDSFIFTKRVGDQPIPVANGQEDVVTLEKCLVEDNGTIGLYLEEKTAEAFTIYHGCSETKANAPTVCCEVLWKLVVNQLLTTAQHVVVYFYTRSHK